MDLGLVMFGLLGAACLILGIVIRAGGLRGKAWEARYRSRQSTTYFRNLPFASIPLGLSIVLLALAPPVIESVRGIGIALLVLALALGGTTVLIALRPPSLFKPAWLREEEST